MRILNEVAALCVAILLCSGCDAPVPLGTSQIHSVAVADTGEVAVVAARPAGAPYIWKREKFEENDPGYWSPAGHSAGKLLYQGSKLLQIRERDIYRLRDGLRVTEFADIADAAAKPSELIIARPWGKTGAHVFFRLRDGQARHLLTSWHFVPGTLAVYDFGSGPELYWAEVDSRQSFVKRVLFSRPWEVEVFRQQQAQILGHPIVVQRRGGQNIAAWLQQTPYGARAFTRKLGAKGRWEEELDENGELGAGAISYTGRWEVGWNRLKRQVTCAEVELKSRKRLQVESAVYEDELKPLTPQ